MPPVAEALDSVPTGVLLIAPAISLFLSSLVVAVILRVLGSPRPTPTGAMGSPDAETASPDRAPDDRDADDGAPRSDTEAVTCPDCGTENAAGYRFCRVCVTELPGSDGLRMGPTKPFLRGIN